VLVRSLESRFSAAQQVKSFLVQHSCILVISTCLSVHLSVNRITKNYWWNLLWIASLCWKCR